MRRTRKSALSSGRVNSISLRGRLRKGDDSFRDRKRRASSQSGAATVSFRTAIAGSVLQRVQGRGLPRPAGRYPRCSVTALVTRRRSPAMEGKDAAMPQLRGLQGHAAVRLRGRSSVVERQLPKLYVVGSIPIARSNFPKIYQRDTSALAGWMAAGGGTKGAHSADAQQRSPKIPKIDLPSLVARDPVMDPLAATPTSRLDAIRRGDARPGTNEPRV